MDRWISGDNITKCCQLLDLGWSSVEVTAVPCLLFCMLEVFLRQCLKTITSDALIESNQRHRGGKYTKQNMAQGTQSPSHLRHLTLFRQMGPILSPDPTGPLPQSEPPSPCPRIVWRCPVHHAFPRAGPGDLWSPSGAVPVPSLPETAWQEGVPQTDLGLCWCSSHLTAHLQMLKQSHLKPQEASHSPPSLSPRPHRTVDQKSQQIMTYGPIWPTAHFYK